jgi:hypothetical protein
VGKNSQGEMEGETPEENGEHRQPSEVFQQRFEEALLAEAVS